MSIEIEVDIEKDIEKKVYKQIGKVILAQIILYTFLTLGFFLSIYDNPIIYFVSMLTLFILTFYLFLIYKKRDISILKQFLVWIFLITITILMFRPINIFYLLIGNFLLQDPIGMIYIFDTVKFFMYFGFLTIFAIVSETIIALYYYYSEEKIYPTETGYGIWDYFLKNRSIKNFVLLLALLTVSAVMEEIIFRFILMNFMLKFNIALIYAIIISSILFGLAHYQNGGWIFCVNSTFAGFIFSFAFVEMGLITAWFLHFFWNAIIIFQMFLPLLYEKKKSDVFFF